MCERPSKGCGSDALTTASIGGTTQSGTVATMNEVEQYAMVLRNPAPAGTEHEFSESTKG
jgi:hypothetical protein